MVHIAGDIEIGRPVDEVFEVVADARNEPRYNPRMRRAEKLSPGPIAVGTRFRSELVAMGRPVEAITEITGYDPPRRLASTSRLPTMEVWGSLTFDLIPGGTRLRWSWDLRPRGALKLMGPALGPVGRRREREVWEGLKRLLEARPAGSAG
ncbi:MAG TPA: SRPBCC family protein [Miltoncostaeaceae bacterium]|nr:SRPBCC family protein [Miltoncostaeaceae bacterium]